MTAFAGSELTTSTSTRFTAGIRILRSKRRWRHSMTSFAQARFGTSGLRQCGPGSLRLRNTSPNVTAGRSSSACKTTTTSSCARKSEKCSHIALKQGWELSRGALLLEVGLPAHGIPQQVGAIAMRLEAVSMAEMSPRSQIERLLQQWQKSQLGEER